MINNKLIFHLSAICLLMTNCTQKPDVINLRLNDGRGSRLIMLEKIDSVTYKTKLEILKNCYTKKYRDKIKKLKNLRRKYFRNLKYAVKTNPVYSDFIKDLLIQLSEFPQCPEVISALSHN